MSLPLARPMRTSAGAAMEAVTVAVSPTLTEVIPPQSVTLTDRVEVFVENLDAAQTVNGALQFAPTASGPWKTSGDASLSGIGPTGSEPGELNTQVAGGRWARVVATASGAGCNVRVWGYVVRSDG